MRYLFMFATFVAVVTASDCGTFADVPDNNSEVTSQVDQATLSIKSVDDSLQLTIQGAGREGDREFEGRLIIDKGAKLVSAKLFAVGSSVVPIVIMTLKNDSGSTSHYSAMPLNFDKSAEDFGLPISELRVIRICETDEATKVLSLSECEVGGVVLLIGRVISDGKPLHGFQFQNICVAHIGLCDYDEWIVTKSRN